MPRRRRRGRGRRQNSRVPRQVLRDQWSGFGTGSSTVALTISGSTTADAMIRVVSGHLQFTSQAPARAQLVLRGYGSEDELISSVPIVTSGSTASTALRAPPHTMWTANEQSNHLAWLRVDVGNSTSITWAYCITLNWVKIPNNTLVPTGVTSVIQHMRSA